MNCKNCFAPLSEEDTYCKVCGKTVEKEEKKEYPSNEEVIASYRQESESLFPSEEELKEMSEIQPVQTLEPEQVEVKETVNDPFVVTMEEEKEPSQEIKTEVTNEVRPEPLPIINNNVGISKKVFILGILGSIIVTALIVALVFIPITSKKVEQARKDEVSKIVTKTEKENRVLLSGYSFKIPEGYSYKINGTQLLVQNDTTNVAISIQVGNVAFSSIKGDLEKLKTNLTQAKWVVGKLEGKTIDNRSYMTAQATFNKKNVMITYTPAKETQTLAIVYLDPRNAAYPDEKIIKEFNPIISSVEEVTNTFTSTVGTYATNKLFFIAPTTTPAAKPATQKTN